MTPLPSFGNISNVERNYEVLVNDKDYDRVFDLAREGYVFASIALIDNLEKVHYYLLRCTR